MIRKSLSFLLIVVLVIGTFSALPFNANAQVTELIGSGANVEIVPVGNPYPDWYGNYPGNDSNCTWTAWQQAYNRLGISLPAWGNAKDWYAGAQASGYATGSAPRANSIVVFSAQSWNKYYGHVAYVSDYNSATGKIYKIEGNYGANHVYNADWAPAYESSMLGYIYLETSNDKTGPAYDDFRVGEFQSSQFTVMAHVTDSSGIQSVRYAVWTENNGQDDIKWYDGHCTDGNDYYWARINFSDHKGEKGKYIIHMYAYDNAGNLTNPGISYNFNSTGPNYSDFHVGEFREGAFTILAKVTDINGISSVRYAVWTEKDGQDDLKWYDGHCTDGNGYYWARVNFSDHKGEKGKYIIHMYAYDIAGKLTQPGISYVFPETGPTVTDVNVSDVSSTGYTVTCKVFSNVGVSRVQFPTWTDNNGQDDINPEWWTNQQARGTISGNTVTFRVKTSEHNRETGTYYTHLYAYDVFGTATGVMIPAVTVPSPINNVKVTDIDESGFTVTCDIDTAWGPISKVEFPTWTNENSQDDLVWHQGSYANGKATCRILTKDHNNALSDIYTTHIYVWDNDGHHSSVKESEFPCLSFEYSQALNDEDEPTNPTEAPTTPTEQPTTPPTEPTIPTEPATNPTEQPTTPTEPTTPTSPSIIILGDVDGDGAVTILDATAIQRHLVNLATKAYFEKAADADGDGEVTILDATAIQRHIASLPTNENIGKEVG